MFGENRPQIVNVSQQLHRMHVQRKYIPCLTPGSNMYVFHRGRCLTGQEMSFDKCLFCRMKVDS